MPRLFPEGQLYKVNVPVVVTQAPVGQQTVSRLTHKVPQRSEVPSSRPPPPNPIRVNESEPPSASFVTQIRTSLNQTQENSRPCEPPEGEVMLGENEASSQPGPVEVTVTASPCTQLLEFQISAEEAALAQKTQSRDIDEILKEVIEEEREKAERAQKLAGGTTGNQSGADFGVTMNISPLSDKYLEITCKIYPFLSHLKVEYNYLRSTVQNKWCGKEVKKFESWLEWVEEMSGVIKRFQQELRKMCTKQ